MRETEKIKRDIARWWGKTYEDIAMTVDTVKGYKVRRTGIGSDYSRREIDLLTGQPIGREELVEVKTGRSSLTPAQRRMRDRAKKKGIRYIIDRY